MRVWTRRLKTEGLSDTETDRLTEIAFDEAHAMAMGEFFQDTEGPFNLLGAAPESIRKAARLWNRLPDQFFAGNTTRARSGDRQIIAEAIAVDADMVITNNYRTIDHREINQWFKSNMGFNRDLVSLPQIAVAELIETDHIKTYQRIGWRVGIRDTESSFEEDIQGVDHLAKFLQPSFSVIASHIGRAIEDINDPRTEWALAKDAIRQPAWARARAKERNRYEQVKRKLAESGVNF